MPSVPEERVATRNRIRGASSCIGPLQGGRLLRVLRCRGALPLGACQSGRPDATRIIRRSSGLLDGRGTFDAERR